MLIKSKTNEASINGTINISKLVSKMLKVIRKMIGIFTIVFLLVLTSSVLVSCSDYVFFSRTSKDMDFTFEYPRGWGITKVEEYSDLTTVSLLVPWKASETESSVKLEFTVYLKEGAKAEQYVKESLAFDLSFYGKMPAYVLLRNENISVDGVSGTLVEYTYDHRAGNSPRLMNIFFTSRTLGVYVPKDGKVYEIDIIGSQNEWNLHEKEIKHVLDTFKWK